MEISVDKMTQDKVGAKVGVTSAALLHLVCKLAMKESIKGSFDVI